MSHEHIPASSPHSPAPITTSPDVNPSVNNNGQLANHNPSAPAENKPWLAALMLGIISFPGRLFRSTKFHPETEARTETRKRPQQLQHSDSVREVIETIVFVVVLVLLLKSFAAEAFVIPTGSMAETLLGYQKEVTCPDCGLKFPINCSQEVDPSEGARPTPVFACVCPNCRQHIHFPNAPREFMHNKDSALVPDPGWNSGDRVLVAKFVYDLLNKDPDRLDVVVFKYPGGNDFPQSGPHRGHVPMNYIKRLIGLPGETIAICGGNLYYLSPDKGPRYDDYAKAKLDPDLMATLWKKENMHIDEAADLFRKGRFQIIRKNPENILSMMRLVFDNDHHSRSDPASTDRWRSTDENWKEVEPHGFRHVGGGGGQMDWLRYQHFLREFPGRRSLIMDIMGYNTYQSGFGGVVNHAPLLGDNWVGDLILECEATIDNPQGELTLELSRGVDRFQAQWDLSTGTCTLVRIGTNGEQKLESRPTAMKKKGTYRLRFANVDQRLVVWVDGDLPFDNGVTYAAPQDLGPREENDLEKPASIGVRGASVAIEKLKLFRDTYYTIGGAKQGMPHEADVRIDSLDPRSGHWDELRDPPFVTLYVQPDHFLCLGDNSPESSDGRSWGAVPRRLLLGRALLVYYPFGRAGRIR